MTIRVLVVDDQDIVRTGIAAILHAADGVEVVGQAADGEQALLEAARLDPDVVFLDVRMPRLDGIATTRALLPPGRDRPRVVMLTTFDLDDHVYAALAAGASAFLLKDALPADLVQAARVVAAGEALLAPTVTRRLVERFGPSGGRPGPSTVAVAPPAGLTPREVEVLTLVGRGMSNREIAADLVLAEQTVKTHVSRVFTKLGLRARAQAVVVAYETGLVTRTA